MIARPYRAASSPLPLPTVRSFCRRGERGTTRVMRNRWKPSSPPSLVALFVLLLSVTACGDDDADVADTTTTEADTTTTTEAPVTTTEPTTGGAPDEIAAVLADGRVALLDAETGDVEQTLLEGIDVSDPAEHGIAVGPDGDDVFVVRPAREAGQDHDIVRVPADGGEPETVAEGRAPAVSPDGSTLAYAAVDPTEGPGQPSPYLVLHDLDSGEERELRREQQPDYYFVVDLAWTADGDQLAFVVGEIQTGLHIVDSDAESLDAAERVGPVAREEGTSWTAVTAFDDERLAVVEDCCGVPARERWHVLAVHPETGAVEGTVLPEERVEVSRLDSDESTDHLVLLAQLRPDGGTLLRWSSPRAAAEGTDDPGNDEVVELRDDVIVAAW